MWFPEPERFHIDELAALVTAETGDDLHVVLAPQPLWRADDAPTVKPVPRGGNRDEPGPADVAKLLSTPPEARYGWSTDLVNDVHLGTLVAGGQGFGLIAVKENDEVYVRTFFHDHLSSVLTGVLAQTAWKCPRPPFSVLRGEILAARSERFGAPRPTREVTRAESIATARATAVAEFYAETRDREGQRRASAIPLRVYDTENEGRWLLTVQLHYGDELLKFEPADTDDIAKRLDKLRCDLNRLRRACG
jgi:ESX secretion-associated protein EspG